MMKWIKPKKPRGGVRPGAGRPRSIERSGQLVRVSLWLPVGFVDRIRNNGGSEYCRRVLQFGFSVEDQMEATTCK